MFSRKSVNEEFNGFLAEGTSLIGDLHFSGTLHFNGNVRGSISTADVLIIGEHATVDAEIKDVDGTPVRVGKPRIVDFQSVTNDRTVDESAGTYHLL